MSGSGQGQVSCARADGISRDRAAREREASVHAPVDVDSRSQRLELDSRLTGLFESRVCLLGCRARWIVDGRLQSQSGVDGAAGRLAQAELEAHRNAHTLGLHAAMLGESSTVREVTGLLMATERRTNELRGKSVLIRMDSYPAIRNLINTAAGRWKG
jgi:hypothetical protein